jgi:hypothetical protein
MREDLHGDVQDWRNFRPVNGFEYPSIRKATSDDETFMFEIAKEKYPERAIERGAPWVRWAMQHSERLVLVGPNSFGIAQVGWFYGMERRARLDMLCARPIPGAALEALKMVRMMVAWAAEQGATGAFRLDADTGVDFEPFARRLGGKLVTTTWYDIPLRGDHGR